jgi:outer membrane lipoprotein-sorting protein
MMYQFGSLLLAVILFAGCKEKSEIEPQLKTDAATLQQVFERENSVSSFSQTFKDTVQVRWEAQWENTVVEEVNDSIRVA